MNFKFLVTKFAFTEFQKILTFGQTFGLQGSFTNYVMQMGGWVVSKSVTIAKSIAMSLIRRQPKRS